MYGGSHFLIEHDFIIVINNLWKIQTTDKQQDVEVSSISRE